MAEKTMAAVAAARAKLVMDIPRTRARSLPAGWGRLNGKKPSMRGREPPTPPLYTARPFPTSAPRPSPNEGQSRHQGHHASRPRQDPGRDRRLRLQHEEVLGRGAEYRALLPDGHARLRPAGADLSVVHQAHGPGGAGRLDERRRARAGHLLRARPGRG